MFSWIYALIDRLPGFLRGPFRAVLGFFLAPWRLLLAVFRIIRSAFDYLWGQARQLYIGLINWANGVVSGLWHITFRVIPARIRQAVDWLIKWASKIINSVWNRLFAFITSVLKWAEGQINHALDLIFKVFRWAADRVASILNWIATVGNRVVDLVLHPDKLVNWILPALWGPLFRFLDSRAEAIGRWFLARSIAAVLRTANVIERVLARII